MYVHDAKPKSGKSHHFNLGAIQNIQCSRARERNAHTHIHTHVSSEIPERMRKTHIVCDDDDGGDGCGGHGDDDVEKKPASQSAFICVRVSGVDKILVVFISSENSIQEM